MLPKQAVTVSEPNEMGEVEWKMQQELFANGDNGAAPCACAAWLAGGRAGGFCLGFLPLRPSSLLSCGALRGPCPRSRCQGRPPWCRRCGQFCVGKKAVDRRR